MPALTFWAIAGLLIAAALLFVLPPLLGRGGHSGPTRAQINRELHRQRLVELERDVKADVLTPAQYEQARQDLERELLSEASEDEARVTAPARAHAPWTAVIVGFALPALAAGVYLQFSTGLSVLDGAPEVATRGQGQPSIDDMAALLETRLRQNPDDRTGWIMLARVNTLVGRYEQAAQAYARADRLQAFNSPGLLTAFAEALALANDQRFAGRPLRLLNKALELQPDHPRTLWLSGWAAFEHQSFARAGSLWQRLQRSAPPESLELFTGLSERIIEANRLAQSPDSDGATTTNRTGEASGTADAPTQPAAIQVAVQLAPELSQRVSPEDTVFVYAQAVDGAGMPLALAQRTAKELPLEVTLDDFMAMAPAFKLSDEEQVSVTARVSKTGDAMPQNGDLVGERQPVSTRGNPPVLITIDQVLR